MTAAPRHLFIIGGQRSGKSRFAERTVLDAGKRPVLIATATPGDAEMAQRIAEHRRSRDRAWTIVEEPLDLPAALAQHARPGNAVLVDCLTLWLSNLFGAARDERSATDALVRSLDAASGPVVVVSNEVGAGIIPENALARRYADALGILNQRIAGAVTTVVVMNAGIATVVKPAHPPAVAL